METSQKLLETSTSQINRFIETFNLHLITQF